MSDFPTIRVSRTCHAQLVRVQEHHGMKSLSTTLERLVSDELMRCGLSDTTLFRTYQNPTGIVITPMGVGGERAVSLSIDASQGVFLTIPEATSLADALDRASRKGGGRWWLEQTERDRHTVVVARRGRGVVIELNGKPTSISEGVAASVAATLRNATQEDGQ